MFSKVEVYVDGGIRRGTDILKCLCLGAKAVGSKYNQAPSFLFLLILGDNCFMKLHIKTLQGGDVSCFHSRTLPN